ncbi:hypothetical protein BBJ28_00012694 [Nothophytophthora sp. Chile5]|nr:hypothetical protein BBJ28_00012694 [Nothophytophthora sp. Chile5]
MQAPADAQAVAPAVALPSAAASRSLERRVRAKKPRKKALKWSQRDAVASRHYNLQLDVQQLRHEIQRLQELRDLLRARALNWRDETSSRYIRTVIEYNRVFKSTVNVLEYADAVRFVTQVMAENVLLGRFSGRQVVLDQWQRYSASFPPSQFQLLDTRVRSGDDEVTTVTVTTKMSLLITLSALQMLFRAVLETQPQLADLLVGRAVSFVVESTFTFARKSHQIVQIDTHMNASEAFGRLLRDATQRQQAAEDASSSERSILGDADSYRRFSVVEEEDQVASAQEEAQEDSRRIHEEASAVAEAPADLEAEPEPQAEPTTRQTHSQPSKMRLQHILTSADDES